MSIVAMTLTLLAGSAQAVEVENLYGGQAIVTGIFEPERTRGLRQVLLDVLVKVSAEPRLIDDPRVQPLLDRARDFVASYEYEDRMKGTPVRDEQGTRDRPHDLRIKFNPAKVDAALAGLGLKPWSSDRPTLITFVAIRYPGNSYMLRIDGSEGLGQKQALDAAALRRGMPVTLPTHGTYIDYEEAVLSKKPPPRRILAVMSDFAVLDGDMNWQPHSASWRTNWTLTAPQRDGRSWTIETSSFDEAFRNGVGEAAATLAGRR